MSLGNLAIALLVIFTAITVALIGEYLYVHWIRRSFRHRSSPAPPILTADETRNFSIADMATKELLYFFRLKPVTDVELDPPSKNSGGSSPDDQVVIDVLKLKEVTGLSTRFLSTIKEEDKGESTPEVDFSVKQVEAEDVVAVTVDEGDGSTKTVFSTPCDSPVFFTPVGSPSRDVVESPGFVVSVHENGDSGDDRG